MSNRCRQPSMMSTRLALLEQVDQALKVAASIPILRGRLDELLGGANSFGGLRGVLRQDEARSQALMALSPVVLDQLQLGLESQGPMGGPRALDLIRQQHAHQPSEEDSEGESEVDPDQEDQYMRNNIPSTADNSDIAEEEV